MKHHFEWDEQKRESNLLKHGIDFIDALEVFSDSNRIENHVIRKEEIRYQVIGRTNDIVIFVVYTHRSLKNALFQPEKLADLSVNSMKRLMKMKAKTDWKKVKAMTERQVIKAAKSDPDALPLTAAELKNFKRVNSPKKVDVKAIREKLGFSQKEFAYYFGVSIRTIQEWEQHRCYPNATARNFLKVIEKAPQVVQKALAA